MKRLYILFFVQLTLVCLTGCNNSYGRRISFIDNKYDTIAFIGNENQLDIRTEFGEQESHRVVRWTTFVLGHNGLHSLAIRKDSVYEADRLYMIVHYENKNLKDTCYLFDGHKMDIRINKNEIDWFPKEMTIYSYDMDGKLFCSEYRTLNDMFWETNSYNKFEYYDNGNPKIVNTYMGNPDNQYIIDRTQYFNYSGLLVKEEGPLFEIEYKYDSNGKCVQRDLFHAKRKEYFEYDNYGRIINETVYSNDSLDSKCIYEYDEKGEILKKTSYYQVERGQIQLNSFVRNVFKYDKSGRITREMELRQRNGVIEGTETKSYSYYDKAMSTSIESLKITGRDSIKHKSFQYYSTCLF